MRKKRCSHLTLVTTLNLNFLKINSVLINYWLLKRTFTNIIANMFALPSIFGSYHFHRLIDARMSGSWCNLIISGTSYLVGNNS